MIGAPGAQRRGHEPAATEPLQLVALAERLADALEALGPDADQLAARPAAARRRSWRPGSSRSCGRCSPMTGVWKTRSAPSIRRCRCAGVLVVHGHLGHQRVDARSCRSGWPRPARHPRAGMFSMPRTSTRNHELVERAQQRQVGVLGEVLVEAELVDGVVAGQPAAQEREGVRDLALDVLAGEPGRLGGQPQHRDRDVHELLQAGDARPAGGGRRRRRLRRWARDRGQGRRRLPRTAAGRGRGGGAASGSRTAPPRRPCPAAPTWRPAPAGAGAPRAGPRHGPPTGVPPGAAGDDAEAPVASPGQRQHGHRQRGTGAWRSLSSGVRRRLARSPLARAAPAASASAPGRAPALPRPEPPRIGTTSGSAIRSSLPGAARGRGCRRPSRPDRGRGC